MEDLRSTRWRRYVREFQDLYSFYVDDERKAELASMGRIRRAVTVLFWILKSLLMKLSPVRRVMLLVALIFFFLIGYKSITLGTLPPLKLNMAPWGFALLLIVLMLELRDKLLARDEIAVARQVQLALFPSEHPEVPGWSVWSVSRPANDVGGDLVDYIELDGFRHGILLGDVAGKGLGAALLTAKLQATLRALVPDVTSLDDLGTRVNDIFHRDGLDNRYATLFFYRAGASLRAPALSQRRPQPRLRRPRGSHRHAPRVVLSAGHAEFRRVRRGFAEPRVRRRAAGLLGRSDRGQQRPTATSSAWSGWRSCCPSCAASHPRRSAAACSRGRRPLSWTTPA